MIRFLKGIETEPPLFPFHEAKPVIRFLKGISKFPKRDCPTKLSEKGKQKVQNR